MSAAPATGEVLRGTAVTGRRRLLRAEVLRITSRRFIRLLLTLGFAIVMAVGIGVFFTHARPTAQSLAQAQQPAPDLPGQPATLPDAVEVAQQMRPAHLPVLGIDERVAGVAIGGHHRRALLADEVQDHVPCP